MKTKPIPIIITLAAAFISCVVSIFQRVDFSVFVFRLLIVVLSFYFLGTFVKIILDYSFRTLEPPESIDQDQVADNTIIEEGQTEEDLEENSPESEEG